MAPLVSKLAWLCLVLRLAHCVFIYCIIVFYVDPKYVSTFLFGYRHLATPLEFARNLHERYPFIHCVNNFVCVCVCECSVVCVCLSVCVCACVWCCVSWLTAYIWVYSCSGGITRGTCVCWKVEVHHSIEVSICLPTLHNRLPLLTLFFVSLWTFFVFC